MTALDIALIQDYTGGLNMPIASQAGNPVRVDSTGVQLEYPERQQTLSASGAWNGSAEVLAVLGSGARTITLANPPKVGWVVEVVDAAGNAATGNITIDPDGATTINGAGTLVLSTNYESARLRYVAAGSWVRV